MNVELSDDERFLELCFPGRARTLGWAVVGGGFGVHERVVWSFVTRAELDHDTCPETLLRGRLAARGFTNAVGMLTARHLAPYGDRAAQTRGVEARAVVTVGLGNALRVGDPAAPTVPVGTVNVAVWVSTPLSTEALVEASSIATEARTLALLEQRVPSIVSRAHATGTGTDCIVVACPDEPARTRYAGKHTREGQVIGQSVLDATRDATARWLDEQTAPKPEERAP